MQNEVHVLQCYLNLPFVQTERMQQTLSRDELERAGRFRFPHDRTNFIAARGTLRAILGGYLHIRPDKVRFRYGTFGKPELANTQNEKIISFSVSHSGDLAVYSVALSRKTGVDIEYVRSCTEMEDIAERYLSRSESFLLKSYPRHMRQKAFFMYWTRREAYLKALGTGLSGLEDPFPADVNAPWSFTDLHIADGYAACLAVEGREFSLKCLRWAGPPE